MAFFDLPQDQLEAYQPTLTAPPDFDAFWQSTLAEARTFPLDATFTPIDVGLRLVTVFDVAFSGWGGQRIRAWLVLPHGAGPFPCVVEYVGYGGGRGVPTAHTQLACAGFAHLIMDTRGQGSVWAPGHTPDDAPGAGPQAPGFVTRGIQQPASYYYRRVFSDAVRAVEAARSHAAIDATRVAVVGNSQGGGIALAAAALVPDVRAVGPEVPFLCHFARAVTLTDAHPYAEVRHFLAVHHQQAEATYSTLAYFDGMNFAARAYAPALFSVGLMDTVCPPSTVYAAYNHYAGAAKQIAVYPYNAHEGGGEAHRLRRLAWLHDVLA